MRNVKSSRKRKWWKPCLWWMNQKETCNSYILLLTDYTSTEGCCVWVFWLSTKQINSIREPFWTRDLVRFPCLERESSFRFSRPLAEIVDGSIVDRWITRWNVGCTISVLVQQNSILHLSSLRKDVEGSKRRKELDNNKKKNESSFLPSS